MPAALLEILPELALGLLLFAACVSYCAGRGLLVMWQKTFGWMLEGIGSFLHFNVTVFGKGIHFNFGHVFTAANNGVVNALEDWISASEEGMARTIRAMSAVWKAGIVATEWLAKETALTFEWLLHVHLPRWAKVALGPVLLPFLIPKLIRAILPHVRTVIVKPIHVIERTLPGKVTMIVHRVGAVALPGALGIPKLWREIHGLTKRNLRLSKRLHRIEGLFGAVAFAGLMANALGLGSNWRCITRGNIGKTARRLCGMPTHLLEDLLAIVADVWVLENVCVLIPLLESAASAVAVPLVDALTVVGSGLCEGVSKPGALRGPSVTVPDVIFDGLATAAV